MAVDYETLSQGGHAKFAEEIFKKVKARTAAIDDIDADVQAAQDAATTATTKASEASQSATNAAQSATDASDSAAAAAQSAQEARDVSPEGIAEFVDDVQDLKSAKANYANVGFNQWDEVWEVGGINSDGTNSSATGTIRSKNYIPVIAGKQYYFKSPKNMWVHCYGADYTHLSMLYSGSSFKDMVQTIPANTAFIRFAGNAYGGTYNNDICINFSQTDTAISPHNGDYVSYQVDGSILERIIDDEREEKTYRSGITEFKNQRFSVADVPGVVYVPGYSANVSNSTTIFMSALATMDSYVFFANAPTTLYFDASTGLSYLALCYCGNGSYNSGTKVLTGTGATRVRSIEGTLPTQADPLTLAAGSGLIITLDAGKTVAINANGIFKLLSDGIILGDRQIAQAEKSMNYTHNKITFDGTTFTLKCCAVNYYIVHEENDSIRQDTWRVKRGSIVSNGVEADMWNGSDADGVVRLKSENDFIGGYHGDEITTSVSAFVDGVAANISTVFSEKDFKTFALFVTSNVYHANDSTDAANVAFVRNKIIYFDGEALEISNYWTASESVNVTYAYFGMLSVAKALVTNYSLNSRDTILDNTQQGTGATYCDRVKMFLNTGNVIDYSMSERSAQVPFGYGELYSGEGVSNRVKAYFAEIYKLDGLYYTVNQGDVIRATSKMTVR